MMCAHVLCMDSCMANSTTASKWIIIFVVRRKRILHCRKCYIKVVNQQVGVLDGWKVMIAVDNCIYVPLITYFKSLLIFYLPFKFVLWKSISQCVRTIFSGALQWSGFVMLYVFSLILKEKNLMMLNAMFLKICLKILEKKNLGTISVRTA